MPSIIGHTIAALGFTKLLSPQKSTLGFWLLAVYCSVLPDIDILTFYFKVPYGHMFGHRGFTHSILFALVLGLTVTLLFFREAPRFSREWWKIFGFFSFVTMSHGLLDAMTFGGRGVGFFVPFSAQRYFFPWRPIEVAPIGGLTRFFGPEGWPVLRSELIWIGIPSLVLVLLSRFVVKTKRHNSRISSEDILTRE